MTSTDKRPPVTVVTGNLQTSQALRRQAEEALRQKTAKEPKRLAPMSAEEIQLQLHELQVHQIELEIQNEELRRTQVKLDATRARYFDLYDLAPIGYCTISEQGLFLEVNLTAATLLGINRSVLIGRRISQSILKEDQDIYYLHRKLLVETGRLQTCELRMVKSDTTVFWVHMTNLAAQEPDGSSVHRIVLQDITERKRVDAALLESEKTFRTHLENSFDVIFTLNKEGEFLFVSNAWERHLGYPVSVAIGKPFSLFVHPDDVASCVEYLLRTLSTGQSGTSPPYRVKCADGNLRWFVANGTPYVDTKGNLQFIGVARDITERKQIEIIQTFLAETSSGTSDESFFYTLARFLAQSLGMDFVCIDRLEGYGLIARTVAVWCDGHFEDNVTYALQDTPCREVIDKAVCCYPAGVCHFFPKDQVLQELKAQSYVGTTLFNHSGKPIGLIAVIGRSPLADPGLAEETLRMVAVRAAGELERQMAEDKLRESEASVRKKLQAILEPQGDLVSLNLDDVVDSQMLQVMMENFNRIMNVGIAIGDLAGNALVAVGWQDICTKFHRLHPDTLKSCHDSDVYLAKDVTAGTFKAYRCKNNMWDMVTPIEVGGRHLGNIYLGQFFYDDEIVDLELFRNQARQYGFNETEYLAALARVPRWSREAIDAAMAFCAQLAGMIATLSYNAIILSRTVSEKDTALRQLDESKAFQASLFETIPVPVFYKDTAGRYLGVNQACENFFGKNEAFFIGKSVFDIHPPEIADIYHAKDSELLKKAGAHVYESKVLDGNGISHDVIFHKASLLDAQGSIVGLIGAILDITEHNLFKETLLERDERLTLALKASNSGIWEWNLLTNENIWSDELWQLYGLEPNSCKASYDAWRRTIHPDDRAQVEEIVREAATNKTELEIEWRVPLHDGTIRWLMSRGKPTLDASGRVARYLGVVVDITVKKQAEDSLRESVARFKVLFGATSDSIVLIDSQGKIIDLNEQAASRRNVGGVGAMLGKDLFDFLPPEAAVRRRKAVAQVVGERKSVQYQEARDGKHYYIRLFPIFDDLGKVFQIASFSNDITEVKREEEYREMSREILQILNEPSELQDCIQRVLATLKTETGLDAVGIRLQEGEDFPYLVHEGFSSDFLLKESSLLERSADGGVCRDKDGKAKLECTCGLVISGKTETQNPLFTAGGSCWMNESFSLLGIPACDDPRLHPRNTCIHQGYVSVALIPIRNKEQIIGLIHLNDRRKGCFSEKSIEQLEGIATHIGAAFTRRLIEHDLRQSEARYAATVSAVDDGLWEWHAPSGKAKFSSIYYRMLGYQDNEFLATYDSWRKLVHSGDLARVEKELRQSLESGEGFIIDLRMKKKSGDWLWVCTRGKAIEKDAEGQAQRLVGTLSDITERKKVEDERKTLQAQLQQAQKMEAIGTLAGGIAHDFNNILGAILGYAEMAQEDSPTGSILRNDIDQVVKASQRAKDLVKQILAFSRQAETVLHSMQPAIIVREAAKMLRSSLPSTIAIKQDIDMDAGLILADPTQIHQIVMNLGTNALHAMEETGGTLSISLERKTLAEKDIVNEPGMKPGCFVQLSVGDTGLGIAPEFWDKIFDPYFTTKEVGKGTGMGLSIIHGIVKNYGGSVSFNSHPGQGTVFQVLLPIMAAEAFVEDKLEEIVQLGNERILFIDDEELLAEMGKSMLERLGYHVTVRSSSLEALTTFQNQPDKFDLIITDQTMPGMTGSDLARRILQIRPFMPIILCTGYSSLITEEKAKSLGIKGFAMKPLARKSIAALIREVLDGGRLLSLKPSQ